MRTAAFSPDGSVLATAGDDATVQLWGVTNRTPIGQPWTGYLNDIDKDRKKVGAINKVAFSPDGHLLATASDSATANDNLTARLWDVASQKPVATLAGHNGNVETVAFSRDGHRVVTASDDGTAKLWDARTHELLATLTGHADAVYGAAFSADDTLLATAGGDRTVRLWDLDENRVTDHLCHIIGTVSREQWSQVVPGDLAYQPACGKPR